MPLFMLMYVIIAILGFTLITVEKKGSPERAAFKEVKPSRIENTYLIFSLTLMGGVCGCRDLSVGTDTHNYVDSFEKSYVLDRTVDGESKFELGYRILVKVIAYFTDSPQIFIFILTLIMFIGTYIFLYNNCSGSVCCSVLVYLPFLYYINYSAIRQAIALAIGINCFQYIKRKQWLIALAVVGLGGLFHSTALVLIILIPISMIKVDEKNIKHVIILCIFGTILFEKLVQILFNFFPIYERYWNSDMMSGDGKSSVGIFAIMVGSICACSYYYVYKNDGGKNGQILSKIYKIIFNCNDTSFEMQKRGYIIALIGTIFCLTINLLGREYGIFSRLARYFIPFFIVLISENYRYYIKQKQFFYCALSILMGFYFYIIMHANVYKIIPYRFFFQ